MYFSHSALRYSTSSAAEGSWFPIKVLDQPTKFPFTAKWSELREKQSSRYLIMKYVNTPKPLNAHADSWARAAVTNT